MLRKLRDTLAYYDNHERFRELLTQRYSRLHPDFLEIERAYGDAKDGFRLVTRDDGSRYFDHVRAVAIILMAYVGVFDRDMIIAALHHDSVEDLPALPLERLSFVYGTNVAYLVDTVTKPDAARFPNDDAAHAWYWGRLASAARAPRIMKLCDRTHNLLDLWSCTAEKQRRKLEETRRYILPIAREEIVLVHELEALIEEREQALAQT
jgi:(p)ppGpp synthase/HD superfamily hydrolase